MKDHTSKRHKSHEDVKEHFNNLENRKKSICRWDLKQSRLLLAAANNATMLSTKVNCSTGNKKWTPCCMSMTIFKTCMYSKPAKSYVQNPVTKRNFCITKYTPACKTIRQVRVYLIRPTEKIEFSFCGIHGKPTYKQSSYVLLEYRETK